MPSTPELAAASTEEERGATTCMTRKDGVALRVYHRHTVDTVLRHRTCVYMVPCLTLSTRGCRSSPALFSTTGSRSLEGSGIRSGVSYMKAGRIPYLARSTASLSSSAMSWRAGTTLGSTYRHRPGATANLGPINCQSLALAVVRLFTSLDHIEMRHRV